MLWFTGGCFENPQRQTGFSVDNTRVELGVGVAAAPRTGSSAGFADAPADDELDERQRPSGTPTPRAGSPRLGFPVREPRRRYIFRLYAASTMSPTRRSSGSGQRDDRPGRSSRRSPTNSRAADTPTGASQVDCAGKACAKPRPDLTAADLHQLDLLEVVGRDRVVELEVRWAGQAAQWRLWPWRPSARRRDGPLGLRRRPTSRRRGIVRSWWPR